MHPLHCRSRQSGGPTRHWSSGQCPQPKPIGFDVRNFRMCLSPHSQRGQFIEEVLISREGCPRARRRRKPHQKTKANFGLGSRSKSIADRGVYSPIQKRKRIQTSPVIPIIFFIFRAPKPYRSSSAPWRSVPASKSIQNRQDRWTKPNEKQVRRRKSGLWFADPEFGQAPRRNGRA